MYIRFMLQPGLHRNYHNESQRGSFMKYSLCKLCISMYCFRQIKIRYRCFKNLVFHFPYPKIGSVLVFKHYYITQRVCVLYILLIYLLWV